MDNPLSTEYCHVTSVTTQVKLCWCHVVAREETDYLRKETAAFKDIFVRAK